MLKKVHVPVVIGGVYTTDSIDKIPRNTKFITEMRRVAVPLPHIEMYEECVRTNIWVAGYNLEDIDWKSGYIER